MADDVQVSTPPGGNGFNLNLKNRSLGLTGPIVIPCLCIFLVAGIGWIRSVDFKDSFTAINVHLQNLYARQDTHRAELQTLILTQFDQTRSQIRAQEERLNAQEKELLEMLQANRDVTGAKLEEQNQHLRQQTEEMRRQHSVILYNQAHEPDQHLMLDLPIPTERGR